MPRKPKPEPRQIGTLVKLTDEFYARCRFASLEEAVEFLNSASIPALNEADSASRGEDQAIQGRKERE